MVEETLESVASASTRYNKMQYTSEGKPYIALETGSDIPIFLTPYYANDAEANREILDHPDIRNMLISPPVPYLLEHAQFWVDLQLSGNSDNLSLQVIRSHFPDEKGTLIGTCSLRPMAPNEIMGALNKVPKSKGKHGVNDYELGYFINPAWSGKGIVTVATKEIIVWAKAEYDAGIVVRVAEDNLGSIKLVERIPGFVRMEEFDDFTDWPAMKGGGRKKILFWKW